MNSYQAKRIPLTSILSQLGATPVRITEDDRWYASPFRKEAEASFKVNVSKNLWYDFGRGEGGNVIDFAMIYFNVHSVRDALHQLQGFAGLESSYSPARTYHTPLFESLSLPEPPPTSKVADEPVHVPSPSAEFRVLKVQPLHNRALVQYVESRGIPLDIARLYVQEIYYTRGEKRYFALSFANRSGGYEIRNKYFKGGIGSKDITIIPGDPAMHKIVQVFEGFFDFLSALVLWNTPVPKYSVLVLNSIAMKATAVDAIKEMGVSEVELFLDRDDSGKRLANALHESLTGFTVQDRSEMYEGEKDLNASLTASKRPIQHD